jgi:hypothetical protein
MDKQFLVQYNIYFEKNLEIPDISKKEKGKNNYIMDLHAFTIIAFNSSCCTLPF